MVELRPNGQQISYVNPVAATARPSTRVPGRSRVIARDGGVGKHWLESGRIELPLPASGRTGERWQRLALLAEDDIVAARIAEAHADAVAILDELGGKPPDSGSSGVCGRPSRPTRC